MAAFLSQKPNANRQIDREATTTSPPIYPFLPFSFSFSLSPPRPFKRKQLQQPNSGNHVFYNAPNVRVANKGDCGINRQLVEEGGGCEAGGKGRRRKLRRLACRVALGLGNATKRTAAAAAAAPLPTGNGLSEWADSKQKVSVCLFVCVCVSQCVYRFMT